MRNAPQALAVIDHPVRAEAHALLDRLLDLVTARPPEPVVEDTVLPLSTAASRLGWSRERLRRYCLTHDVPVNGRGKLAVVDLRTVRASLSGQRRVKHDAPSRETNDDIDDWLGGR